MQITIQEYNGSIENLESVKNQIRYNENRVHPYSNFLDDLK